MMPETAEQLRVGEKKKKKVPVDNSYLAEKIKEFCKNKLKVKPLLAL